MSRLQEFYAARAQNLDRRSKLAAWADWAEAPPKPKQFWFNRETYLVPEWPMPAAPSPDGQSFALLDNREVAIRSGNGDVHKLTSGATEDTGWDLETANASPWSPNGHWLFACAVDRSAVAKTVRTRFGSDGGVTVEIVSVSRLETTVSLRLSIVLARLRALTSRGDSFLREAPSFMRL